MSAFALALPALPVSARQALQLEEGADWVHSHSGIIVPATLGGVVRSGATAFEADALDTAIQFDTHDGDQSLSVYIYRDTNGAVPVWFAQAQGAIEGRDLYANATQINGPEFASLPGRDVASGLRSIYKSGEGARFSSTGVAIFAVGDWYLKVRASSATRSTEELAAWMDEAIGALTIPDTLQGPAAIAPIADCNAPLKFSGKAKDATSDLAADLATGIMGFPLSDEDAEAHGEADAVSPPLWCRDPGDYDGTVLYRPDASETSYLMALGDSGRSVWVAPDEMAALLSDFGKKKARYTVAAILPAVTINFVAQDRLPTPERVWDLLNNNRQASSVNTWGDEKTLSITTP